jgi:Na+/proline symporter
MFTFTGIFVLINLFFLSVGALLYIYADKYGIAIPNELVNGKSIVRTDYLFPEIAFNHFSILPAVVFLLGLTAATFATTDSALTALTTSFCIDFLGMEKKEETTNTVRTRHFVHLGFSFAMFLVILLFKSINDQSVVTMIFILASYTYGPLLGLFAFGLLMKKRGVQDKLVPYICLLSPLVTFIISKNSSLLFDNYVFDNELIILNGGITFLGLLAIQTKKEISID